MPKYKLSEEDDYDSYYEEILAEKEESFRRKNTKEGAKTKGKYKGHQSKHGSHVDKWESLEDDYISTIPDIHSTPYVQPKTKLLGNARAIVEKQGTQQQSAKFTFGPNTHEIKGNMIDFDRVMDIQKVESEHNGRNTFGIKFLFLGKKGLFRIAWFNQNMQERDKTYDIEKKYWESLESYLTRK